MCFTGIVYARRVGDRVLTFGVSGALWNDAMVMFDRETGSLWSQVTGECIEGPLVGARLRPLDAILARFDDWARANPGGRVLTRAVGTLPESRYRR